MEYYDYLDAGYTGYSSSAYATDIAIAALAAAFMIYAVIGLVWAVLQVIAMWKIFSKAGEKGWKSIIPIYNLVVLYRISGLSPWLLLILLIPLVNVIAGIILTAIQCSNLSKAFGHGGGYAVGLFFLGPIFYLILAFDKSEYIGVNN